MLLNSFLRSLRASDDRAGRPCLEVLEPRIVLAGSPFPVIGDLIDPNNTVVRIETNFGDIDIELFDQGGPGGSTAPVTTANFLNYVRDGDWDETFMHRLVSGFVLQMGGFAFSDEAGVRSVTTDPAIVNEFNISRSNIERTVAMAKLSTGPNTATSQFFINLVDNSANLNFTNGGFTVFGRIATDASWSVVQIIAGLNIADFSVVNGALGATPVADFFASGDPISEEVLVNLVDVEIIKPASISASDHRFFTEVLAYPEGYRAETITEIVALVNPGTMDAAYQIVVRYERGARDEVIASGTLASDEHRTITISDFADPTIDLVREGVPFAIEIHSTGTMAASLTHTDFGATQFESFFSVRSGESATLPLAETMNWSLGGTAAVTTLPGDPNITRLPFLVYLNDSAVEATVTTTFTLQAGGPQVTIVKTLDPHRRGGLEMFSIAGLTDGLAGIAISSTQPIVAALSQYEQHTSTESAPVLSNFAYGSQLMSGAGHTAGVLAGAKIKVGGENYLSVHNNNSTGAVVTFQFVTSTGTVTQSLVMAPNSRTHMDLADVPVSEDEFASISYTSGSSPVSVQFVATNGLDTVSTAFAPRAARFWTFAGGSFDANDPGSSEVISVFNPYKNAGFVMTLIVKYYFSDGTSILLPLPSVQIDSGERVDLDLSDTMFAVVRTKIQSDPQFSTYSVSVIAQIVSSPGGIVFPSVVAQMTQIKGGSRNSSTTMGVPLTTDGNYLLLTDPAFFSSGSGV
ncbi:MAG: peptidylprolyl isomerase [Planctomycetes bacterium]|nr:peptidylprolyl isomerase [Planctomycetota bacterium]